MGMNGIDVSQFNGVIDWKAVRKTKKVDFAYIRATEGLTITDDQFKANHDGCKANGIPFGVYHFYHFNDSPEDQATRFIATVTGLQGQLLPMVDIEGASFGYEKDETKLIDSLAKFMNIVEHNLVHAKKMVIYTNPSSWNERMGGTDAFAGHTLWVANFTESSSPDLPNGWKNYVLWQWSENGTIKGIPLKVDLDRLAGDDLSSILI